MTFRVGQKVEHIAWQAPWYLWPFIRRIDFGLLNIGRVYTVAAVYNHGFGRISIDLRECPAPRVFGTHEGWISLAFRPVVERKTEVGFTIGADPSTDQFDNRRKVRKKVTI